MRKQRLLIMRWKWKIQRWFDRLRGAKYQIRNGPLGSVDNLGISTEPVLYKILRAKSATSGLGITWKFGVFNNVECQDCGLREELVRDFWSDDDNDYFCIDCADADAQAIHEYYLWAGVE
jgi:hypothetical protein